MSDDIYSKLELLKEEISLLNYKLSTDKKFILKDRKNNVSKVRVLEAKISKLITQVKNAI